MKVSASICPPSPSPETLVAMLTEVGTKNTCPKKEIRLDCCRKSGNNGGRKSKKSKFKKGKYSKERRILHTTFGHRK